MSGVVDLRDGESLEQFGASRGLVVVHFWAPWSQPCQQMNEALEELAKEHENVKFVKVEAENFPDISLQYEVVAVPTFIFLKGGKVVDRVNGAHVPDLTKKTALHSLPLHTPSPHSSQPPAKEDINDRLKKLVNAAPCMVFMKGTPQEPRCGFSRQLVAILNEIGVEYSSFNILADEEVRQALKSYSNWPTYPQLYVSGELIGGLDIVKEMKENGELESVLPKTQSLDERLKTLINQAPIMVFMKGSPEQPRCGFSRSMCELLKDSNVEFSTFDILQDQEVRQGLKKFSNWPTYPQLYSKGELIGGLDIARELKESGELLSSLGLSE